MFFLMIRRPPRSTLERSSAASDVYKRQIQPGPAILREGNDMRRDEEVLEAAEGIDGEQKPELSLIHISEPTRPY